MSVFCTCVIPTIGRDSLDRAVMSVLSQSIPDEEIEILVINDSGSSLQTSPWMESERVRIIDTNRRERSVARNTGAAVAHGRFVHFLDDDDWIAEGAYKRLWELHQSTDAGWLYGAARLLDRNLEPTILLKHELRGNCFVHAMAGEWIPLQASLIDRLLFWRVGGFDITLTGPEDIDLERRAFLETDISGTASLVAYIIRGAEGSTTNYDQHAEQSRRAREGILDSRKTFSRMRKSATGAEWNGRMTRVYLTSVVWNIQHRRLLIVLSRLSRAASCLFTAGKHLIAVQFWKSIFRPYQSLTFERGIRESRLTKKDS